MNKENQIQLAATLLNLPVDKIEKCCRVVDDANTLYISIPVKGGDSLLIAQDGSVLYAVSAIPYKTHYEEFKKGRRTPLEAFNQK